MDDKEQLEALQKIMNSSRADLITADMIAAVQEAQKQYDRKKMGELLGAIYANVTQAAGGMPLDIPDDETFGKKLGWLLKEEHSDKTILDFLAQTERNFAKPAMENVSAYAANLGLIKEVVREMQGRDTCAWCRERAGIWNPYDANIYGVWGRHAGCDCKIYIRYVTADEEAEE